MARLSSADTQQWLAQYIGESDNPDLQDYGGYLTQDLKSGTATRFIWWLENIIKLGEMWDKRVLDVGCGFGWNAAGVSMLGANQVVANDIRESMTAPIDQRVAALKAKGAPIEVETLTGDVCALDLPAESFDAIMSTESIEHIHDIERFLSVSYVLLKTGGRIVITNDSNALNKDELEKTTKMWERREHSWEYIEELKKTRPIENADIKPYAVMRQEIVEAANPDLTSEQTKRIVDATAGWTRDRIEGIAKGYTDEISLPTPDRQATCRNPETGEYCERLLDPYEIRDIMARVGFEAKVLHAFRRLPLFLLNGVQFRPLNLLLFTFRGAFVLVGERS